MLRGFRSDNHPLELSLALMDEQSNPIDELENLDLGAVLHEEKMYSDQKVFL